MRGLLRRARSFWRVVRHRSRFEAELSEELRFHIERRAEDLVRAGMEPAEAARRARLEFGSTEWYREEARRSRGLRWIDEAAQDLSLAWRSFRRRPGLLVAAVVTLALGIGATTALLTMVDHILLRPLAYRDAAELHSVWGVVEGADRLQPSYPDFTDWRGAASSVDLAFAYGDVFKLQGEEGVEEVLAAASSSGVFGVLDTAPAVGRVFGPDEEREGAPVVVLSYGLWQRRFGGDPETVGRSIVLEGMPHTVVGVMPRGFEWPEWAELWVPLSSVLVGAPELRQRDMRTDTRAVARLGDGVSRPAAEAELRMLAARLAEGHPETNRGLSLRLSPLREEVVGDVRATLVLMLVAAGLVLLLACANVAAMLLGRTTERARELAIRCALGASRGRLLRQLVVENGFLGLAGGALGAALAFVSVRWIGRSAVGAGVARGLPLPRLTELAIDGRVLWISLAVTLAGAVLFAVAPALLAAGHAPAPRLRERHGGGEVGRGSIRAQSGLAIAQLAIAVALVAGAALLLRTLHEIRQTDPGFEAEGIVVLRVFPPESYPSSDARLALYDRLALRAAAVPGVSGAALINHMPFAGGLSGTVVAPAESWPAGAPAPDGARVRALYRTASPDFFSVAGLSLIRGRGIAAAEANADVVVLSEGLAAALWPGESGVGRHVRLVNPAHQSDRQGEVISAEVVGIAGDVRNSPTEAPLPTVYVPHARDPWGNIFLVVRAAGEAGAVIAPLRSAVAEVDASLPTAALQPLAQHALRKTQRERMIARLMTGFGVLALLLSAVGTYGTLSNLVVRRMRELGVRLAVGARPADLRRLVLARAGWMIAVAVVLGSAAALVLGRLMQGLLFGVEATDPWTLLAASGFLAAVGLVASSIPALRAGRVDPVELLASD